MAPYRIHLLLFAIAASAFVLLHPSGAFASEPTSEAKKLVETVLAGIDYNYSQIQAFRASLLQTTDRPWVETIKPGKSAKGGQAKLVVERHSVVPITCIGRGADFRYETDSPKSILLFSDDVFTQYHADHKIAWRRRPTEMIPVTIPWDPRNIGVLDDNRMLTQILREDKLLDAQYVSDLTGERIVRVIMINRNGKRLSMEFDPSTNLLPKTCMLYCSDGNSINVGIEIKYQKVPSGSAWYLHKATCRIYRSGVAHKPNVNGWNQIDTIEVKELSLLGEKDVPDSTFKIDLPSETVIHDNISGKTLRPSASVPNSRNGFVSWLFYASLVLACGILFQKFFRQLVRNRTR
jgi:hypothetical protein